MCTVVVITCFVVCWCACAGYVLCGCFDNWVGVLIICILVCTVFCTDYCFYVVSFMYIYSYFF
jgi:hypothetical protein